jgi:KDO2-lipid IV(A) lauroyltransferase
MLVGVNVVTNSHPPSAAYSHDAGSTSVTKRVRHAAGLFWQRGLMGTVIRCPWLIRALTPGAVWGTWLASPYLRANLRENARAVLGPESSARQQTNLGKRTLRNFFEFIIDLGRVQGHSVDELMPRIAEIEGVERYLRARALGRGAILVSSHLGSFEIGLAALRKHEPRGHVVFQRDVERKGFERLRASHRQRLGIMEAPIDDGLTMWLGLRDALGRNEVVLMHGDRVMPGQKGVRMDFLDRCALLPTGPVRLALASGAPIVPLFAPRDPDGRIRILLEEPIIVDPQAMLHNDVHPAMRELAATMERIIRRYPDQWLMVHRPWCKDDGR